MGQEAQWALEELARDPLLRCVPVLGTSRTSRSLGLGWDPPALPCLGGRDAEMKVKGGYRRPVGMFAGLRHVL